MNTKQITNIELDSVNTWDYPDFCDAYICSADWENGKPLSDNELDELNEDADFVYSKVMESLF